MTQSIRSRSVVADDVIREREVFSYYTPLKEQFEHQRREKYGERAPTPVASPDRALTAFAQLGALRLDVRRTVISLFDRQNQYVLAEATRTLSLQKDDVHDEKDELWLGVTTFPRSAAPCEYGAGLYAPERVGQEHLGDGATWFDLTMEPFSDLPYVSGYPYARFYAGVPIISPDGFNIGVYSVIDDRPRQGLTEREVKFLEDMASTVMEHLKMIRAKDELRKTQNMVTGLGNFVDGRWGLGDLWEDATYRQSRRRNRRPTVKSSAKYPMSRQWKENVARHPKENVTQLGRSRGNSEPVHSTLSKSSSKPLNNTDVQQQPSNVHHTNRLQEDSLSKDVRSTFQRATNILREALELDGAMIMDASVWTFGGLTAKMSRESMASSSTAAVTTTFSDAHQVSTTQSLPGSKPCMVLGESVLTPTGTSGVKDLANSSPMTERFLHSLLEKYPKGKIWSFDDEERDDSQVIALKPGVEMAKSMRRNDEINRKGSRWIERRTIRQLLPGVRSLVFVGMWDHHRGRWFAGSILWSYNPIRVFSHNIELNYSVAFGQSLMVEVARLDAKMADEMKATFISSISHELRTPLHGIMGSSECLQATGMDAGQNDLVATIETCGKTLLDTFENLLAFAKINQLTSRDALLRRGSTSSAISTTSHDSSRSLLNQTVNLGVLVEEAVEASFAGHRTLRVNNSKSVLETDDANGKAVGQRQYFRNRSRLHDVSVVFDCQDLASPQWICETQPGAWRRLVLNLLGNSLKYTERGSVTVKLEKLPAPTAGICEVVLTVIDTGKGMSDAFLDTKLFAPFAQEDPLASGTGLGLSIVKHLAECMDGHVFVRSKKDQGTEVRVTIPIELCREDDATMEELILPPISESFSNSHINVLVDQTSPRQGEKGLESVFAELCQNWFGLTTTISTEPVKADAYVTIQENLETLAKLVGSSSTMRSFSAEAPLIIICQDVTLAHAARTRGEAYALSTFVEYLPQPFCQNKIAKVLAQCFDRRKVKEAQPFTSDEPLSSAPLRTPSDSAYEGSDSELQFESHAVSAEAPVSSAKTQCSANSVIAYRSPQASPRPMKFGQAETDIRKSEASAVGNLNHQVLLSLPKKFDPPGRSGGVMSASPEQQKLSVLIVDDNHINLRLLAISLKKQKHRYSTATNGLEAWQAYQSAAKSGKADETTSTSPLAPSPFDFILMDINMPVMDGLESTRQIRAFEREMGLQPAKIFAITGSADPAIQQEAFASGIDLFLTKPVRMKVLEAVLKREA